MKVIFISKRTFLLVSFFCLTACEALENLNENIGVFESMTLLAIWSLWWLIPALFLYCFLMVDKEDTKTISGTVYSTNNDGQVSEHYVSKGEIVKGNSVLAQIIMFFWLLLYPLMYFYWPLFKDANKIAFLGFPNLDWFILKIITPLTIIIGCYMLSRFLFKSKTEIAKLFKILLQIIFALGVLNLCIWGLANFIEWLS